MNHERDNDEFNSSNKDDVDFDESRDSFSNRDSNRNSNNATHDNSSSYRNTSSTKGLPGEKALPDKYFCEGSPSKLMMEALKELNVNDIKDFLMAGGPEKTEQFEKEKRAPPPQY